jgi:glycosyltransferase involved in cell wall biosynthesis
VPDLHVGLDLTYLGERSGGSATYAHGLIAGLRACAPDVRVTAWAGRHASSGLDEGVEWVGLPVRGSRSPARVAFELAALGLDARRRGVEVVHGLAYGNAALAPGVATVTTLLDLTWRHHPDSVTPLARRMFRLMSGVARRRADRVIALSESARADLIRTLDIPGARVDVTPLGVRAPSEGVDAEAARARLGVHVRQPLVVAIGADRDHKNLAALVRAVSGIPDAALLMAGDSPDRGARLHAIAAAAGAAGRIRHLGWAAAVTLEDLYGAADCLCLPALAEGFGLPALEAMARGVPVACSDIGALREVTGVAAERFDPRDEGSMRRAIARVLGDPDLRARLVRDGRERAAAFTWERTAELTVASYRRAIEQRQVSASTQS